MTRINKNEGLFCEKDDVADVIFLCVSLVVVNLISTGPHCCRGSRLGEGPSIGINSWAGRDPAIVERQSESQLHGEESFAADIAATVPPCRKQSRH